MPSKQPIGFLDLPPELRLEVYKDAMPKSHFWKKDSANDLEICGLWMANNLIHREMRHLSVESIEFTVISRICNTLSPALVSVVLSSYAGSILGSRFMLQELGDGRRRIGVRPSNFSSN